MQVLGYKDVEWPQARVRLLAYYIIALSPLYRVACRQ